MSSKREIQQKDLAAVLAKDIGGKNPVFSSDFVGELHSMFSLYADPRQRRADIRDILMTAKTLGLDTKYEIVFHAIQDTAEAAGGDALDFETFLKEITARIVVHLLFRETPSTKKAEEATSTSWTPKERESSTSTT